MERECECGMKVSGTSEEHLKANEEIHKTSKKHKARIFDKLNTQPEEIKEGELATSSSVSKSRLGLSNKTSGRDLKKVTR